jgi:acetylornithine deacetylase/succinyl-diaminopimelate desuccinylase-like protein
VRPRPDAAAGALDRVVASRAAADRADLAAWLRIPGISTDPLRARDCRRAADWLAARLRRAGCRVALRGSATHPVVVATNPLVRGAPTVVVYGHYDVQPAGPRDQWASPPFEPRLHRGALYARGASDDKGQVLALVAGYEAAVAVAGPRVNVRFVIEGQEESGGQVLARLLRKRPRLVSGDAVLVADAAYPLKGWPAIEVGVRGLCYVEISVRSLKQDLHSGLFGGVAPNAHEDLVRILSALKGSDGRVRVPGLYARVRRPSTRERRHWARLPFDETAFLRNEVGARAYAGVRRAPIFDRLWALPTMDIHGIQGGFTGAGVKTVIPAEATAKVSFRLVPNQRHREVLMQVRRTLARLAPPHATVKCRLLSGADPVLVDSAHPAFALLSRAFEAVDGRPATFVRSGGSLPIVAALGAGGAAVLLTGIGLPDDSPHGPNEKLSLGQLQKGIRVFARFFLSAEALKKRTGT